MPRGRPRKTQGDILLKSAEMIGWAIGGLEREIVTTRERLSALTAQANALRAKLPGGTRQAAAATVGSEAAGPVAASSTRARRRRKMSPEARQRISEMMTKRWAERRKTTGSSEAKARKRKRGGISPEGRKRISEMMKKRWADRRKAAK
jgi:hypothetical protein